MNCYYILNELTVNNNIDIEWKPASSTASVSSFRLSPSLAFRIVVNYQRLLVIIYLKNNRAVLFHYV